tara:strand:+ start:5489 stop:6100 length:612 start_codon:yes stop_codon:yes gene_type:complete
MQLGEEGQDRKVSILTLQPEKGHETSVVGMVIFLGSWLMAFLALFFSFLMIRFRATEWPPGGIEALPLTLPIINTCVVVMSSLTLRKAVSAMRIRDGRVFRRWLTIALGMGSLFLVLQIINWASLWNSGFRVNSGAYGSFFYTLTAFHGLHVLAGIGLLVWLVFQTRSLTTGRYERARVRVIELFWHFVGVVWIAVFGLVYLV